MKTLRQRREKKNGERREERREGKKEEREELNPQPAIKYVQTI